MSKFANSPAVILKNVRLQWATLFEAKGGEINGEKTTPKFKAVVLLEPGSEAFTAAKNSMLAAAVELWGANAKAVVAAIPTNSKALRDGKTKLMDDGSVNPQFEGLYFVSASNKSKPQVVAQKRHNGKFVTITEAGLGTVDGLDVTDELGYPITVPYSGCYVNAKVTFTAGKADPSKKLPNQVFAKLEAVQFVRDGEAFGAGPTSAEGFDDEDISQAAVDANELFE